MGFNGDLMGFNGDLMGFHVDFLGFNGYVLGLIMELWWFNLWHVILKNYKI